MPTLAAQIQSYSAIVQVAIAAGKLLGSQVREFIGFLRGLNNEPMSNAELDAITAGVLEQDLVRKALADAEAGGQ